MHGFSTAARTIGRIIRAGNRNPRLMRVSLSIVPHHDALRHARLVGSWLSASGYRLRIKKVRKDLASVDFLDPHGASVQRPYMKGAPSVKMIAHYDDYNGILEVDLWEEGKGFILDLTHEYDYELDLERREALVPTLSRNERDRFLDEWYSLFGPLDHFVRRKAQNKPLQARAAGQLTDYGNSNIIIAGPYRSGGCAGAWSLA